MESYSIQISATAEKALKKIPKKDLPKVIQAIQSLGPQPFPPGHRKLKGEEDVYRIRQGNYRIIYEVRKSVLLIRVLKLGHRKDIYR